MTAIGALSRARHIRFAFLALSALAAVTILPRWFEPEQTTAVTQPLHGDRMGNLITYRNTTVADVLHDVGQITGFTVAAFPSTGLQRFSGTLVINPDGRRMAEGFAGRLGLSLRRAGPHWVLDLRQEEVNGREQSHRPDQDNQNERPDAATPSDGPPATRHAGLFKA